MTDLRILLITIQASKLQFTQQKPKFEYQDLTMLGLGISRYRKSTLKDCTNTVLNLMEPVTIWELHRLINMFGYYRNFIRNIPKFAKPLNELKRTDWKTYKSKLIIIERWTPAWQEAYDELKKCMTTVSILAQSRFDRWYILYSDSS